MSNEVSQGAVSGRVDLSAAPGADLDWDNLFLNPEVQPATPPQAASGTNPQQQPQATQTQPFIKAGETVYNTAEDAINGITHKDSEIAKYRSFLKENGIDPNTMKRTAQSQAQPQQPQAPGFFDKVAEAASKGDKVGYENAMKEFFTGLIEPWRPTLAQMNQFKAYQQVSRELPGFKDYYENGGYQETLEKNPLLKDMNQIGENDPTAAQRLPEIYRLAYFNYKGIQPASQVTTSTTQTNPTVRPQTTMSSSTLTPPAPVANTTGWQEPNWRGAKSLGNEARKQLIQDGDNRFKGMRFEDVNL